MRSSGFRTGRRGFRNPFAGIVAGPILAIGGVAMAFFGWQGYTSTKTFMVNAEQARGTVVEVAARSGTDSSGNPTIYFYPVVEFTAADGRAVRYQSSVGSSRPSQQVGQAVEIVYNPANPQDARVNSFTEVWLWPVVLLGMGAVFVLAGVGAFFNSIALIAGLGGLLALLFFWRKKARQDQNPPAGNDPA